MYARVHGTITWHRKTLAVSDAAMGVWVRLLGHCAEHLTDGFIPEATARAVASRSPKALQALLQAGFIEQKPDGFQLVNYLEHNVSRAKIEEEREATRIRVDRSRKAKRNGVTTTVTSAVTTAVTNTVRTPLVTPAVTLQEEDEDQDREEDSKRKRDTSKTGRTDSTQGTAPLALAETTTAADAATSASAGGRLVRELFEHWQSVHKHPTAKLDDKRRRSIERAIKSHGAETVRAAISGCAKSAFHKGDNDRGAIYDDLTLILRDASKIEHFAALEAQQGTQRVGMLPKGVQAVRTPVPVPQAPERPMSFAALRELRQKSEREAFAKEVEAAQSAPVAAWGES